MVSVGDKIIIENKVYVVWGKHFGIDSEQKDRHVPLLDFDAVPLPILKYICMWMIKTKKCGNCYIIQSSYDEENNVAKYHVIVDNLFTFEEYVEFVKDIPCDPMHKEFFKVAKFSTLRVSEKNGYVPKLVCVICSPYDKGEAREFIEEYLELLGDLSGKMD